MPSPDVTGDTSWHCFGSSTYSVDKAGTGSIVFNFNCTQAFAEFPYFNYGQAPAFPEINGNYAWTVCETYTVTNKGNETFATLSCRGCDPQAGYMADERVQEASSAEPIESNPAYRSTCLTGPISGPDQDGNIVFTNAGTIVSYKTCQHQGFSSVTGAIPAPNAAAYAALTDADLNPLAGTRSYYMPKQTMTQRKCFPPSTDYSTIQFALDAVGKIDPCPFTWLPPPPEGSKVNDLRTSTELEAICRGAGGTVMQTAWARSGPRGWQTPFPYLPTV